MAACPLIDPFRVEEPEPGLSPPKDDPKYLSSFIRFDFSRFSLSLSLEKSRFLFLLLVVVVKVLVRVKMKDDCKIMNSDDGMRESQSFQDEDHVMMNI